MATYKMIQNYVFLHFGYKPKTCWIAHAKEIFGLPLRPAGNRIDNKCRVSPCPESKLGDIEKAFQHFGLI